MNLAVDLAQIACLVWMVVELRRNTRSNDRLADGVDKLRLTSRARVSQANLRNTPVSEEAELRRLGRSTFGKRVVVGGDEDSELHQSLSRAVNNDDR